MFDAPIVCRVDRRAIFPDAAHSFILNFRGFQSQRIADDGDGARRHRRRRDDRGKQHAEYGIEHARRNGHAGGVVNEGEEQVLPDIPHRRLAETPGAHDPRQVAAQQCPRVRGDQGGTRGVVAG